jgi:GTP-binding protein Era
VSAGTGANEPAAGAHRAGIVALLGPPNAGKSTLLNHILGHKVAIVTAKPQTTRSRILGIHSLPGAQIVLIDTPGLHTSGKLLNIVLNEAVEETARDCELALVLVDRTRGWTPAHDALAEALRRAETPAIGVGTKLDLVRAQGERWPPPGASGFVAWCEVSARTGEGIPELLEAIVCRLPESPPLYPEDDLTDRPLRWLAAELVREALFEELDQELPYGMAVEVVEFDESRPELVKIRANLLVVRGSQKRIVVGAGGQQIKRIGVRARREIEALLGTRVHLDLWVKVDARWAKNKQRIEELGYG